MDYTALYATQDTVLSAVFGDQTEFYLTGGTCLHRFHAPRRHSDDLDLFTSDAALYRDDVRAALDRIRSRGCTIETRVDTRDFVRIVVDGRLRVDLVNDRVYRHGAPVLSPEGYRLDNLTNIFANKICALVGRDEPKDVFDLCLLAELADASADSVLGIARRKCVVDLEVVEHRLMSFPPELFKTLAVTDLGFVDHVRTDYNAIARTLLEALAP